MSKENNKEKIEQLPLDELDRISNEGWENLHKLYANSNTVFLQTHAILPFLKDAELIERIEKAGKKEQLTQLANALNNNVKLAKDELNKIYEQHKDKNGDNVSPDELMLCIDIGQQYNEWNLACEATITNNVKGILNLVTEIEKGDGADE